MLFVSVQFFFVTSRPSVAVLTRTAGCPVCIDVHEARAR
jgi:hypothetical protein